MQTGRLKVPVNSNAENNCESPECASCDFGKDFFQTDKIKLTKNNLKKDKELNKDHLLPEHMVLENHYISRAPVGTYHKMYN